MSETIEQSQSENYSKSVGTSAVVLVKGGGNDQLGSGIVTVGGTINVPRSVVVHNAHASQVLYVGWGSDVTSSSGFPIAAGGYMEFELLFTDELWAVGSGAGTDARVYVLHGKGNLPFDVLDLSPVLWLDASDTSTITESGGAVSTWADKSGNGYNVTQGTASAKPKTGTATINGLNVLEYDGTSDAQTLENLSINLYNQALTWFWVIQVNASDTYYVLNSVSGGIYGLAVQDGSGSSLLANDATLDSLHVDGVSQSPSTRNDVYDAIGTGAPKLVRAASTATTNTAGLYVTYTNGANFSHGTQLAELIIVDTPTAGQIADTETYLADKWGITI